MFSAGHNGTGRAGIALLYGSFSACRLTASHTRKTCQRTGKDWLVYLQAPDTTRWRLTRDTAIIFRPKAVTARNQQMILVGKTTQRFVSFSRKDVQTAAADLISGRLQSVEITYMEHALWIQCATHKDKEGCFVINAVHPDYTDTAFTAKMSSAEAFMWLTQYPCGGFLPEGEIWEKKAED